MVFRPDILSGRFYLIVILLMPFVFSRIRFQIIACFVCLALGASSLYAQSVGGIGARLALDSAAGFTLPRIQGLVPGSPAAAVLKDSLYILSVAGYDCKGKSIEDVVAKIRGDVGTTVKITVADNKAGKKAKEYDLVRAAIQMPANNTVPAQDPLIGFNEQCERETKVLRRKGLTVVKTYTSDCGNYFFNFDADANVYHVRLYALMQKNADGAKLTARIFDGNNEAVYVETSKPEIKESGDLVTAISEGEMAFKRDCVGVVNTHLSGDAAKCRGMFIVIYK